MSTVLVDHEHDCIVFTNSFPEGKTHDYTEGMRGWGHDYIFEPRDGGMRARVSGWGHGIKAGDFLMLTNKDRAERRTTRYQITQIEYMTNPHDQWFADAIFAPCAAH